jgi:hypothetical protein
MAMFNSFCMFTGISEMSQRKTTQEGCDAPFHDEFPHDGPILTQDF